MDPSPLEPALAKLRTALNDAQHVVVLTGSGVSAESKIPTFRDAMEGLWKDFDPQTLATPEAFEADPGRVTRWYDWRRLKCAEAQPNPGHLALAEIQTQTLARGASFTLLTQNVDGLHQRAGSTDVVELHGSIMAWRGVDSGEPAELPEGPFESFPPTSASGEIIRPSVVWFGEMLPEEALRRSFDALERCDLFMTIGTSSVVHPAAGFVHNARANDAFIAEVNPDDTPISPLVNTTIRAKSGEALPLLLRA
ncbi:MAG: NAD-dependent deacylase [Planctomycetota bacterium]